MARVVGPLMSLSASGTLKKTITYRCGEFVHKIKNKPKNFSEEFEAQQEKFKAAAFLWSETLTSEEKAAWKRKALFDRFNVICNHIAVALPLVAVLSPVSFMTMMGLAGTWVSGYDAWMSFYLTLGPYGWPNYPAPPPDGWVPPNFQG